MRKRYIGWSGLLWIAALASARPASATEDLYVAGFVARKLFHVDAGGRLVAAIPLGGRPLDAIITPGGRFVYVSLPDGNMISVVRTADDSVIGGIPAPSSPCNLAMGNAFTRLYVANNTVAAPHVTVIDITKLGVSRKNAPLGAIDLGPFGANSACSVAAFGDFLAVGTQTGHVMLFETRSDSPRLLSRRAVGTRVAGLVFSPLGTKIYALLAAPAGGLDESGRITPPGNLHVLRFPELGLKEVIAAGPSELKGSAILSGRYLCVSDIRGAVHTIDIGTDQLLSSATVSRMLSGIAAVSGMLFVADPAQSMVHRVLTARQSSGARLQAPPIFLGGHVAPVGVVARPSVPTKSR